MPATNGNCFFQGQRPDEPGANFYYYWLLNSPNGLHWTLAELKRRIAGEENPEKPFDWVKLLKQVPDGRTNLVSFEALNRRQFGELVTILRTGFGQDDPRQLPKVQAANLVGADEASGREPTANSFPRTLLNIGEETESRIVA